MVSACAAALMAAPAGAHPGHGSHPGMPGATASSFVAPFPVPGVPIGGYASENVEFVANFPQHTDTAGARRLGDYFYITTERDLTIYDISEPLEPVEVGYLVFEEFGQPVFTEEDPDTNGEILLVDNADVLMVIDVRDKANPSVLSTLEGAESHTVSCVLDCTWAYGSPEGDGAGKIFDLRDPENPKHAGTWTAGDRPHDVTEIKPGIILTSTQPLMLLDAREDPAHPKVLAQTQTVEDRFVHANLWPRGGADDFVLVGGEDLGPGCAESISATFSTWDGRALRETGTATELDEFRILPGDPTEGRAPDSSFCVHWFDEHPYYKNGGLVAIAWYEHGTHFLQIDREGQIEEVGWFLGGGGQASAAYWIDERTVYVADYLRGLDILRFNGEIGEPPAEEKPPTGGEEESPTPQETADEQPAPPPASDDAPAQTAAPAPAAGAVLGERAASARLAVRVLRRTRRGLRVRITLRPAGRRFDLQVRRGRSWRRLATRSRRRSFVVTVPAGSLLRARTAPDGPWRLRRLPR